MRSGGMMSLEVKSKTHEEVMCEVVDGGELKSRRHLSVRGKSATLPSITGMRTSSAISTLGIESHDLIADVSMLWYLQRRIGKISSSAWRTRWTSMRSRSSRTLKWSMNSRPSWKVLICVLSYVVGNLSVGFLKTLAWFWSDVGASEKSADIHVIVKIESADSIPNLQSILDAADGVGLTYPGSCSRTRAFCWY